MSQSKRKRGQDESGRPSKKKSVEHVAETVKFSCIEEVGEWSPVIAQTPGLSISPDIRDAPWKIYTKTKVSRQCGSHFRDELLLHNSSHEKLDYIATEETSGSAESLLKHYIGIYDPRTGEVQMVPARNLVVRSILRADTPTETEADAEEAPPKTVQTQLLSYHILVADLIVQSLASRTILGEAFGTKKAQKAIRSLTENAIANPVQKSKESSENVPLNAMATAVMNSMPASSAIQDRESLQAAMDEAKPRPKANLSAESPADVYTIEDIVGLDVLRVTNVEAWQDAVRQKQNVPVSSRFVARRLTKVVKTKDLKRLKALKYLYVLIQWQKCLKSGSKGTKKLPQKDDVQKAVTAADGNVLDTIRIRFAPDIQLNKWAIDNLMTHICALALILDNYEIDSFDLREDLGIEHSVGLQYYKELGCRIVAPTEKEREKLRLSKQEASTHKIAKLNLPLEFPKMKVMRPKRR